MIGWIGALVLAANLVEVEPARVLVVVLAPRTSAVTVSSGEILGAADRLFREAAHVSVISPEQAGVSVADFEACPVEVRSSCWVKNASGRVLVVLTIQPDARGHAIALAAIDLEGAARELREEADEIAEERIWGAAVKLPRETIATSDHAAYFQRALTGGLGELLRRIAPKEGLGRIRLENVDRSSEVELDGKSLGVAAAESVEISGVSPGTRVVRVRDRFGVLQERSLLVSGGGAERVVFLERVDHTAELIGGFLAVGAGGALLVAHGLSAGDGAVCATRGDLSTCDGPAPGRVAGTGGVEIGRGEGGAPLYLVFGSAVLAGGATWTIGQWLADDADPWILFGISVAASAAVFGAGYALTR